MPYCPNCASRMGSSMLSLAKPSIGVRDAEQPKAITLYEKVKHEIEELKNSIDTSPAETLLKKVKLAIDIKDYSSAEDYVKECIHKTHELKKVYEKAADSLKLAWPCIKKARDEGTDVTRSDELIKEARKALRAKQCQKSLELANLAVDLLLSPIERKKKKCDEIRDRINTIMDGVRIFGEIKGVGLLLVHEAETLIRKAEREYNAEVYDGAIQLYKKSEKSLDQLKEQYLYKQAESIYAHAESMVNEMEKTGKSVPGTAMALLKAKDALDYEDYDDVIFYAVHIKTSIDKWEGERTDEDAIQAISRAQFILADLRKTDADTTEVEELFQQAKDVFEDKDFAKAEELALTVATIAEELKKEGHRKKAEKLIIDIRKEITDLGKSMDTSRVEEQFAKAEEAYDTEDYMTSIRIVKRLGPQIQKSRDKAIVPKLEKSIGEATRAIEKAKERGMNTLMPENLMRQAKFALENKRYNEVDSFIQQIMNIIEKSTSEKEEKASTEYKKLIPEAMKAVQKIRGRKWDVKSLVEKLKKAPGLLKEKKYGELEKVTLEVKNEATRIFTNEIIGPAKRIIEESKAAIDEAREKNADISEAEKQLKIAYKLFTEKKFHLVTEKAEPIIDMLKEEEKKISIHRAEIILEFSEKIINAYNKWGIAIGAHKKKLVKGNKALKARNAEEAILVAKQLEKDLEESRMKFLRKKTLGAIKYAKSYIKKSKALESDIESANELLAKAGKMLDDDEILRAWSTALESNKAAGMDEKGYFKLKCNMTNTILLPKMIELRNTELDTTTLEKRFAEYESTYKKKDYANADKLISKVAKDAHHLEQMFITGSAIKSISIVLKEYSAAGVKIDDIEKIEQNAKGLMNENKFVDALHLMEGAIEKAENMKDEVFSSYSPDEKVCNNCEYPVIIFEPHDTIELQCPICDNSIELNPPPPVE